MDNNEILIYYSATKGAGTYFQSKTEDRQVRMDDKVTADNVGAGITVAAGGWASGTDILMTASSGNSRLT